MASASADTAAPVVVRPHGPTDVAAALLDVSQPFDDDLLERLNGWIAGTTGTPYDPPPPRAAGDGSQDWPSALSGSIWPSASFRAPSAAASSAVAASPAASPDIPASRSQPRG